MEFTGGRIDHDTLHFQRKYHSEFSSDGIVTFNETNLKPEYNYDVTVSIKTSDIDILSISVRDTFESPAGSK